MPAIAATRQTTTLTLKGDRRQCQAILDPLGRGWKTLGITEHSYYPTLIDGNYREYEITFTADAEQTEAIKQWWYTEAAVAFNRS